MTIVVSGEDSRVNNRECVEATAQIWSLSDNVVDSLIHVPQRFHQNPPLSNKVNICNSPDRQKDGLQIVHNLHMFTAFLTLKLSGLLMIIGGWSLGG